MTDYEWYKSKGICPKCRANNAFENHVLCAECLEITAINNTKYSHKKAEYQANQNVAKRIRYQERKQAGACTRCGKSPANHGLLCSECYLKRMNNRRNTEYQKHEGRKPGEAFRQRMEAGLCMYCGKEQVPRYKFCKSCLEKRQEIARKSGKQNSKNSFMRNEVNAQWKLMKSNLSENI